MPHRLHEIVRCCHFGMRSAIVTSQQDYFYHINVWLRYLDQSASLNKPRLALFTKELLSLQ